ncbi:hypothetical protein NE686_07720 [Tissierella carlieri]|uniref:Uncharacterized protein n=1 Tax=Tissierella carlieri TaxID=689904 RepID=A0ABT1S920_9FIRM|nr:hypothetical protein [Tissierella carlieri]MCQ4922966.1 hypothetical protein [Tissierella carlieri]
METFDPSVLELIEISTNDTAGLMFTEIFSSVVSVLLLIVMFLYFANLALSFLRNI